MPAYVAANPIVLYPGDQGYAYGTVAPYASTPTGESRTATVLATGTSSQAFCIAPNINTPGNAPSISLEIIFSGDPGAFNFQIQDADTDATSNYVTVPTGGTITAAANLSGSTFVARVELVPIKGSFVRLKTSTQTANAVTCIAKFTR
jgi:hypothetical protein